MKMNKQEFLTHLRKGLHGLSQEEIDERLTFYSEMIDDRIEEGCSEEEAVSAVGDIDDILSQIPADVPPQKPENERKKPQKPLKAWEIVLLALGSPIWLSLLIAAFAVLLSLYAVLWSATISLWAVFGSVIGCALGGVAAGIVFICTANALTGIAMIGAGVFCAGLSIFVFYGCKAATKGIVVLTKKLALWIKSRFGEKEMA